MLAIRFIAGLLAATVLGLSLTASAQTTPVRLRGAITAIDGKTMTIAVRDGTTAHVNLADNWAVSLVTPLTLADIKQGSFVGIASTGTDADRTALEVLVFPEAMRGTGEGHYAWDLKPNSMMTNANVATVASASDGQTLKLDYKGGGTQTIKVKPGTPIVTFQPGQQSDAKVGAKVFVIAQKAADGSMTATRMAVGKDGLTPPM
jgi:endonuclease YncB( thermonuclease family)